MTNNKKINLIKKSGLPSSTKKLLEDILQKKPKVYDPVKIKNKIGSQLISFYYPDPITKDLTVFDKIPLIILLNVYSDGFLGVNLHHISEYERSHFKKELKRINGLNYKKIKKSFQKSVNPRALAYFAIRRYKFSQVRSQLVQYEPKDYIGVIEYLEGDIVRRGNK